MDRIRGDLDQRGCASPFLLCNGDAEIFSRFEFPKPVHVGGEGAGQVFPSTVDIELPGYPSDLASVLEPMLLDCDLDILHDFFNRDQPMDDAIDRTADLPTLSLEQDSFGVLRNEVKLSGLASDILESASNAGKPDSDRSKALTTLKHLLSPAQAHKALSRYFESWHRICGIIHRPTFTVDTTPDVVLAAALVLGSMYLSNEEDREKTLSIIDFVEDFIFSQEPSLLDAVAQTDTDVDDDPRFHFLQAAFLIVVTQYWTGNDCSRRRVSKIRFDRVIEVRSYLSTVFCSLPMLNVIADCSTVGILPRDAHCRRPEKPSIMARQRAPYPVCGTKPFSLRYSDSLSQHFDMDHAFGLCLSILLGHSDSDHGRRNQVRLALR